MGLVFMNGNKTSLTVRNMVSGPLPEFRDVFKKWFWVIEKYCEKRCWEDVPWWYNERASLSLFAAAVWNSGGIALEEYSTSKSHRKERWPGRGDIYVSINGKEYIIEAKQVWCSISGRAQKSNDKIEKALFEARHAAGETKCWGAKRLGLVFAIPYLSNSQRHNLGARIDSWLEEINSIERTSLAWILDKGATDRFRYKKYLYPGVAVLLRPLRQSLKN